MNQTNFQQLVFDFYQRQGRHTLPWRHTEDPYCVLVSEVMLQQTQAERVIPKYEAFISRFPSPKELACAAPEEVLALWQGLGYNRRALSLQRAAREVVARGTFPATLEDLQALPGVGSYTAAAVIAFAYNKPVAMIETNIRRVYLHHFFPGKEGVADTELMPIIEETQDKNNPREWYYALMDYGSWLAKQVPNANVRSKHYTKQSAFEGSLRQLRGKLVRYFLANRQWSLEALVEATGDTPERVEKAVRALQREGFPVPAEIGSM